MPKQRQSSFKNVIYLTFLMMYSISFSQVDITLYQQFNGKYDFLSIGGSMNTGDNGFIGSEDFVTTDNSSAFLNIPADASVLKAYLYWAESYGNNNETITLNNTSFTADQVFYEDLSSLPPAFFVYGYRKDVTNYVINNPTGLYEVDNIDLSAFFEPFTPGATSPIGVFDTAIVGWSILVIYEQNSLDYSQINLYDGFISKGGVQNPTNLSLSLQNLEVIDNLDSKMELFSYLGTPNATIPTTNLYFNNIEVNAPPLNPSGSIINSTNTYTNDDEFWNMDLDVYDMSNFINIGDTDLDIFLNLTNGTNDALLQRVVTKVRSELPNTSAYFNNITGQNDCNNRDLTINWALSNENSTGDLNEDVPVSFYYKLNNGNEILLNTVFINQNIPIGQILNFTETLTIPDAAGLEFELIIRSNDPGDGTFLIDETSNQDNTDILEITLFESPEPLQVIDIVQCANLSDSFFNLETAIDETLNSQDTVSFFSSQSDAENDINPILNSLNYNPQNLVETIYVRRFDGNCYAISQFQIESLVPPQINTPLDFTLCDFSDTQDGFAEFNLDSKIDEITGGNPDYEVNFFNNQADAEDLTISNGIASPFINEVPLIQTIYVRVKDVTNNCHSFTQFDLVVNLLPDIEESSAIPALESCDNQQDGTAIFDLTLNNNIILNGLNPAEHVFEFYETQAEAENDINPIVDAQNYSSNEQSIFVRVTEISTGCYSTTSYNLLINEIPDLQAVPTNLVCDLNDDGFATFFLPLAEEFIMADTSGFSFQYFDTLNDAQNNTNSIVDVNNYQNTQSPTQTLFVKAMDDVTGCQNIQSIQIEVVPADFIPFDLTDLAKCEPSTNGINIEVDLTEQEPFIFGQTDPNNFNLTYHLSQADAASGDDPIINPENFFTVENPQEIWVRLVNTTSNCVEIGSFNYEILLAPVLSPADQISTFEQCADEQNAPVQNWDLENTIPSFYDTPQLANITFHLSQSDAENNVNAQPNDFQNTENPQSLFVRAEATESGCVEYTSIELLVNTIDDSFLPSSLEKCDTDNDGFIDFDFQNIIDDYAANLPQINLSFHQTFEEATTQTNALSTPYVNETENQQTIYVYAFDNTTACENIFELDLIVKPIPLLTPPLELRVCDNDTDDISTFDLTLIEEEALDDFDADDLLITYHTSLIDAETNQNPLPDPTAFENTQLPQSIWIRAENPVSSNNCYDISSFELGIDFLPIAGQPNDILRCDVENFDQIETFDLSLQNDIILDGLSETENILTYHATLAEAEAGINPVANSYTNENNPQTIYARLENINASDCFTTTSFEIEVAERPFLDLPDELILCKDEDLVVSLNPDFDEYLWSTGNTSSTININSPGTYQVTATNNFTDLNCDSTASFEVVLSNQAVISDLSVIDWRQSNNSISIIVEGEGDYEYSIDGVNYQDSNTFENLNENEYLVRIRDKNGCGETLERVFLLDFPQYFTPNGDGINDRWQIINSSEERFTKILIFDRYGKLIANINPNGLGWDGNMNGKPMPSNDYWFRVEREDGRVHTGNFTLKR